MKFGRGLEGHHFISVRHARAHRSQEQIDSLSGEERHWAEANRFADHHAKLAASLHPAPSP
eukprot:6938128-Pyramimonas_sp.AAC.1